MRADIKLPDTDLARNPRCDGPDGCNEWEARCPIPSAGIPSRWCAVEGCRCIALVSQGYCEGCYVAMK